jgi:fructooligosaccharide transport system permease protein
MQIENIVTNKRKGYFYLGTREYNIKESIVGASFLAPVVGLALVFVIVPIIVSLFFAFTNANLGRLNDISLVGIKNFLDVFQDSYIWPALKNTLYFVGIVVPLQFGLSLGLALLLNKVRRMNSFLRWAFFAPVMLSLAVTSFLWLNLLNPQEGLMNALLGFFGLGPSLFLEDTKLAMPIIILISAWQGAGYQMLIMLSGLKNIPKDLYEAASIDRANKLQQFFHVTLPALKPTIVFVLITMIIGAFRIMVQPMIMTNGGPLNSTLTMSLYIYRTGVTYKNVGYSSAIALLYTIVIASISLTLRKVLGGDNEA